MTMPLFPDEPALSRPKAHTVDDVARDATFSECGLYRYTLSRWWGTGLAPATVNFIMLNPSTADAEDDDATVTRCIRYARDWAFDRLIITNLFAYRSTDPAAMKRHPAPIGPDNDATIIEHARDAELVVCAWGAHGCHHKRDDYVVADLLAHGVKLYALRFTKFQQPQHPLRLPAALQPIRWEV